MKMILSMIPIVFFMIFAFTPNTFAQDSPQWHLPEGAKARLGKGSMGHIAYSPDGNRLAVASGIGIWIYNAASREALDLLTGPKAGCWSVAYSPDGHTLVSGHKDSTVRLWDAVTGQPKATLIGHTGSIWSVVYSPDGHTLATGSTDDTVRLWDAVTGQPKATLIGHTRAIRSVAYSPDGHTLATAGDDGTVRLWDAITGQSKATLDENMDWVGCVAYSPDGRTLAASGNEDSRGLKGSRIHLWNTITGQLKNTFAINLALTSDRAAPLFLYSIAYSPDGRTLAIGGFKDIFLLDASTGTHLQTLTQHVHYVVRVVYSPDGRTLASSGSFSDNTVNLWDTATGQPKATLTGHTYEIYSVAYSPDGQILATVGWDDKVRLWDTTTSPPKNHLTFPTNAIASDALAFSPDGTILASESWSDIHLWNVRTRTPLHTLTGQEGVIKSVVFSPDGQTLASGGGAILLWNVRTGTPVHTLTGHTEEVMSVAFSPDGTTLASGGHDFTIHLWDANTGRHLQTLTGHTEEVTSVAFSPDGQILASGSRDDTVRLWDANTGRHLQTLTGHTEEVTSVAFSPDGQILASGSRDDTVRLWDAKTGEHLRTLEGHMHLVSSVAFSPDGTTLASGSYDGTVLFWELTPTASESKKITEDINKDGIVSINKDLVRLIYFVPNDTSPQPDISTKLDALIKDAQLFYANQMNSHGFGSKTFNLETNANGNARVYQINGKHPEDYYLVDPYTRVLQEIPKTSTFDRTQNLLFIAIELTGSKTLGGTVCGKGGGYWDEAKASWWDWRQWFKEPIETRTAGGSLLIPASGTCFEGELGIFVTAHELGHALGLDHHDFRDPNYIMSYGNTEDPNNWEIPNRLSKCAAAWFDASRFFNVNQSVSNEQTTQIEMLSTPQYIVELPFQDDAPSIAETLLFEFEVTDMDGLHQALLLTPTKPSDPATGYKMHSCQSLDNHNATAKFYVDREELPFDSDAEIWLQVIDVYGNITRRQYDFEMPDIPTHPVRLDVNGDGTVDLTDTFIVIANLGKKVAPDTDPNPDVNRDGIVDIKDLAEVAVGVVDEGAAPSTHAQLNRYWKEAGIPHLPVANIQQWLIQAKHLSTKNPAYQKGATFLEQLLVLLIEADVVPEKTTLLPNYPNPFNPETWIPYQLSKSADVTLTIYTAKGEVIRILQLGNMPAGIYQTKNRAVYWDGKNALGEPVVSGVYFYTLTAGDFTATRKMLILM